MFRRFPVSVLLVGAMLTLPGATFAAMPQTEPPPLAATAPSGKPICPVMLDEVEDPSDAAYSDYRGKRYYFCCPACKPKFDKNPRRYIRALEARQRRMGKTRS
ncbi:YHS domain-containing protein [Chloracidobacterium aggregatum]|uniref:YHS domain-containing protein n=1 Tax=Chloracidobacterium aggregatum TaxID=2851959 RepID=UPI001FE4A7E3|nr:YHS domain-containing protein [Chloracidobacterium aggregatum]